MINGAPSFDLFLKTNLRKREKEIEKKKEKNKNKHNGNLTSLI